MAIQSRFLEICAVLGMAAGFAGEAQARMTPASAGRAVWPIDAACFLVANGTVTNNCSSPKYFEVPLTVDFAGAYAVEVTAFGATISNNVGCTAVAGNREATLFTSSPRRFLASFGAADTIFLSGALVPNFGFLVVNCLLSPGARIHSVSFNP